ncbi:MAG: COQ9 family protein [Stellaceae bacterium]
MTAAERDRLIEAVLPDVPFDGWSRHALLVAGRRLGLGGDECAILFPAGARDLVAYFSRWADRQMLPRLSHLDLAQMRVHERVAAAVMARLDALALHREAVRRALAILAFPTNAPLGARLLYETVDAIWFAVGDEATDFSFYSKRALLAGIYAATALYWLDDRSANFAETRAFLDRRLAEVAALPRWRARIEGRLNALPNPFRAARAMRSR